MWSKLQNRINSEECGSMYLSKRGMMFYTNSLTKLISEYQPVYYLQSLKYLPSKWVIAECHKIKPSVPSLETSPKSTLPINPKHLWLWLSYYSPNLSQFQIVSFPNQNECTRNVDRLSVIFLSKLLTQPSEKENKRSQFQFYQTKNW